MASKSVPSAVLQPGGRLNDELVFDGGSLAFNGAGELIAQGRMFAEIFMMVDTEANATIPARAAGRTKKTSATHWCSGLRDYLHKCRFKSAVLGLQAAGIDSALVAYLPRRGAGTRKCARRFAAVSIFIGGQPGRRAGCWRRIFGIQLRSDSHSIRLRNAEAGTCNRHLRGGRRTPPRKIFRRVCGASS